MKLDASPEKLFPMWLQISIADEHINCSDLLKSISCEYFSILGKKLTTVLKMKNYVVMHTQGRLLMFAEMYHMKGLV